MAGARALTFVVLVGRSSEATLAPHTPVASARSAASLSTASEASQEFAAAFTAVLRSPAARAEVHRVLRESPYTRHKIHLQAWLHDARAARIVEELARALGQQPAKLLAQMDALPALEMSLPRRSERQSWRVSEGLSVAAKVDAASTGFAGATSTGGAFAFPSSLKQPEAVLAIKPMQAPILRFNPQPARPSAVIEDPDDGEIGIRSVSHHANGDSTVLQHATVAKLSKDKGGAIILAYPPPPDDGGGGGGGGGTYYGPPMKLGLLVVISVIDMDLPFGHNEFRFEATHFQNSGAIIEQRTTAIDGVGQMSSELWNMPLLNGSPSKPAVWNGTHVNMIVYEDDGWLGRDDFFDGEIFSNHNDAANGLLAFPRFVGGDDRCGYDQRYTCPWVKPDASLLFWRQVNFNVRW